VTLDAGVPVNFLRSLTHDIEIQKTGASKALVTLRNKSELPNKDFVLQYDVSGREDYRRRDGPIGIHTPKIRTASSQ